MVWPSANVVLPSAVKRNKPFLYIGKLQFLSLRGSAGPRLFVTKLLAADLLHLTSLDSQTTARAGPSVLRFWPSRFASNCVFSFKGAWAPPPISTDGDGRWPRRQFLFSPSPGVSRLVIYSGYVWQSDALIRGGWWGALRLPGELFPTSHQISVRSSFILRPPLSAG